MCPELHAVARFLASEQGVRDESKYKAYIQRWTSPAYRVDALEDARRFIPGFEPVLVHELRDVDREQLEPAPPPEKPAWLRRHRRRAVSKTGRVLSRGEREQQETRNKRLKPGSLTQQKARRDAAAAATEALQLTAARFRVPGELTATDMLQREHVSCAAANVARAAFLDGLPRDVVGYHGVHGGGGAQGDDGEQGDNGAQGRDDAQGDDGGQDDDGAREEVAALGPAKPSRRPRGPDTCSACGTQGHKKGSKKCSHLVTADATTGAQRGVKRAKTLIFRELDDPEESD
jgi:hypothetical protein